MGWVPSHLGCQFNWDVYVDASLFTVHPSKYISALTTPQNMVVVSSCEDVIHVALCVSPMFDSQLFLYVAGIAETAVVVALVTQHQFRLS